jgi:Arc/MetJ family transcription regulator
MRTNIVIDDDLMREALRTSGLKTRKEVVGEGLKLLVQLGRQKRIREFRGKLTWAGNLDEMRRDR